VRFYYFLPLLGGGQEGVLEKSKETPPSSSPKRGGELRTYLNLSDLIMLNVTNILLIEGGNKDGIRTI
jgi:hypothetical protein